MFGFLKKAVIFVAELLIALAALYFLIYGVTGYRALKQSQADPVFQQVIQDINRDAVVTDILGSPIEPELLFFDYKTKAASKPGAQTVDLVIPIYGPKHTGTLFAKLTKSGADWRYSALLMQVDGFDDKIDLLLLAKEQ